MGKRHDLMNIKDENEHVHDLISNLFAYYQDLNQHFILVQNENKALRKKLKQSNSLYREE